MKNVYFINQACHNKTNDTWTKGFVVKADPEKDNEAAALQTYHAYLGAYGYGNNADIDYVKRIIRELRARFNDFMKVGH